MPSWTPSLGVGKGYQLLIMLDMLSVSKALKSYLTKTLFPLNETLGNGNGAMRGYKLCSECSGLSSQLLCAE